MAPIQLSNAFIYVAALVRPSRLQPHLRVPSIDHVDFRALKKEGYNAVVIDKDNCLTLPHVDNVWPPYQTAWDDLLKTFRPGRVLVVSNSAGTPKDPGGIAAEAVSLSLRAPVLVRPVPKPGCSSNILSYFGGKLGQPHTLRHDIASAGLRVWEETELDETMFKEKWKAEIEGPLLGKQVAGKTEAGLKGEKTLEDHKDGGVLPSGIGHHRGSTDSHPTKGDLRILVIGDRLFTDTLLADRLSRRLRSLPTEISEASSLPRVLSIYTTSLPQPRDVRPLRWLEEKLSRGETKGDFTRFISPTAAELPGAVDVKDVVKPSRWTVLRWLTPSWWREIEVPPLTWHPRSWKPLPLAAAFGKSALALGRALWIRLKRGARFTWKTGRKWIMERRASAERRDAAKELELTMPEAVEKLNRQTQAQVNLK